ncbi:xanthine dehydrogenase molybdopterin binding subunit [Hylemonella gracilis]|uniref:Aldehyde oxidase and xanthine dehydrogenase, molybdopterin binding n=1 Tax=Hylemonella gracilis ATCC 19624 TaxID=887062 RepID=F3KXQ0_9BURK|nr:xanthine dehydrogenase molybdopterin binding subunit [Hylemonella gracilis]EGI75325.1 aldehyde oxidase and xanthine dehydrogenase, molybdopterin binding [Hylemonella gracilis ATCC 19624]
MSAHDMLNLQVTASGQSLVHESARLQVQGLAPYIDDLPELRGTLHAAPILSPIAHGRLRGIDPQAALAMPGVVDVVLAADIPGDRYLATPAHDEPIFAVDTVQHVGQVVGLVVARTVMQARRAARAIQQQLASRIEALPAVLDARTAHAQQSYVLPPVTVQRGAPDEALAQAEHRLSGRFEVGGQEHFYLEGQIAYAQPQEGERGRRQWLIHSSSQHPGEVQHWVAHALGLDGHDVQVVCRRMGGGFGGKETQAGHLAVWTALAARKTGAPVKLRLDRDDDFMVTGKRHPFAYDYEAGFDGSGRLTALKLTMLVNCGFSADLSGPVADRAIFHSDNAYYLSDVCIRSYRCKTNTQSHTAFRGFGGPQGVIAIETILGDIARHLGLDALDVRLRNLYSDEVIPPRNATEPVQRRDTTHYQMRVEDNILQPLMDELARTSRYRERRAEIATWNRTHAVIKKGLALTPVKFGISFTATLFNQAGALVHVYADGSVLVNHGGTEMGQGLHTKIGQIVADELGVPNDWVRLSASDTARVPNASATAASSGTDLNGRAAQFAARQVRDNLAAFVAGLDHCGAGEIRFMGGRVLGPGRDGQPSTRDFREVVKVAYANRIQLWSDGFYRTPKIHYDKTTLTGRPFYYFAYGAACSEVAIDTHTGETRVLAVDILHDVGRSINPAIDLGQVEGGFIQGMGWLTSEELVWDQSGKLATHAPSTYKIPATGDLPPRWRVDFWPEANREDNVHGSKAVGEPPFMLAISVWEAIRDAIAAARHASRGQPMARPDGDSARSDQHAQVPIDAPATPERVFKALRA